MRKKLLFIATLLLIAVSSWSADQWDKSKPDGDTDRSQIDDYVGYNNEALDRLLANYKRGLEVTYSDASTLAISAGEVVCSNSGGTNREFRANSAATTATASDLDSGVAFANSTAYCVYATADTDVAGIVIKISTNTTSPSGITNYYKIGTFSTDGSGDISLPTVQSYPYSGVVPAGGIIMWSGAIADIPSGWVLCNGSNGTPDLRDRFVICATADVSGVAKTNVTGSYTLSGDGVIPAHTHTIPYKNFAGSGGTGEVVWQSGSYTITSGSSGTGTKNIAVYYALAFIMKL